jgi:hypothetical protein
VVVVCRRGCSGSRSFINGCRVVCPHATDATVANAMLNSIFFMFYPFLGRGADTLFFSRLNLAVQNSTPL